MAKKARDYKAEYQRRIEKGLKEGKTRQEAGGHYNINPVDSDNPIARNVGQTVGKYDEFTVETKNWEKKKSVGVATMLKMMKAAKTETVRISAYGLFYLDPAKTSRWIGNLVDRDSTIKVLQQMLQNRTTPEKAIEALFNLVQGDVLKVTAFSVLNPGKEG